VFRTLKPHQLAVDLTVAVVLFIVTLPFTVSPQMFMIGGFVAEASPLFALPVAIILCGALAIRRLSPALALIVAWVAALAQMAIGLPPLPVDVAVFGILYVTAAYGSRALMWIGLASSFVAAGFISFYLVVPPLVSSGKPFLSAVQELASTGLALYLAAAFALLLSWTVGALARAALRARENRLAQRRAEAETVAEQERVRIARDMHDVVAHSLAVVIAQADGARYAAAANPTVAAEALGTISTTARAALADVRLLLTQLRHSQGDGPQPTLADLETVYAQVRAAGVDLRVDVDPAPHGTPPAALQLAVYRILQEALTNALRHGDRGPVSVRLAWLPGRVEIEVRNGVPAGAAAPSAGHGVIGMRERAQLVGGSLDTERQDDEFVVRAVLPTGEGAA